MKILILVFSIFLVSCKETTKEGIFISKPVRDSILISTCVISYSGWDGSCYDRGSMFFEPLTSQVGYCVRIKNKSGKITTRVLCRKSDLEKTVKELRIELDRKDSLCINLMKKYN